MRGGGVCSRVEETLPMFPMTWTARYDVVRCSVMHDIRT